MGDVYQILIVSAWKQHISAHSSLARTGHVTPHLNLKKKKKGWEIHVGGRGQHMNFWKMVTVSAIGFYNKSTERFVSLFTYKVVLCKEWLYKQHFNDNFCLRKKSVILALLSDCRYKERRKNNKSILKKGDVFISLPCSDAVERKDLNLHHSFSMGSFCVLKQSHLTPVSAVLQLKKKKRE